MHATCASPGAVSAGLVSAILVGGALLAPVADWDGLTVQRADDDAQTVTLAQTPRSRVERSRAPHARRHRAPGLGPGVAARLARRRSCGRRHGAPGRGGHGAGGGGDGRTATGPILRPVAPARRPATIGALDGDGARTGSARTPTATAIPDQCVGRATA